MMATASIMEEAWQHQRPPKRKSEAQDNERLSKRMSLLNLGMGSPRKTEQSPPSEPATSSQRSLTCPDASDTHRYHLRSATAASAARRPPRPTYPVPATVAAAVPTSTQAPPEPAASHVQPAAPVPEVTPEYVGDSLPEPSPFAAETLAPPVPMQTETPAAPPAPQADGGDMMRLDDTTYKVYIYDLDAELASEDESSSPRAASPEPSAAEGERIHLLQPDLAAQIRQKQQDLPRKLASSTAPTSIPKPVPPAPDGSLGGVNVRDMQLVLYDAHAGGGDGSKGPESEGVRRLLIEARERARAKSTAAAAASVTTPVPTKMPEPTENRDEAYDPDAMDCD